MSFDIKTENLESVIEDNKWVSFLKAELNEGKPHKFKLSEETHIEITFLNSGTLLVKDQWGSQFKIDFINDKLNYFKKKLGLRSENLAKALGSGQKGWQVLDLSAGLGIDSIFMAQMGFTVMGIERNPIIFTALKMAELALKNTEVEYSKRIHFEYAEAEIVFDKNHFSELFKSDLEQYPVGYFDPMFPEKNKKTALPRQEMVIFKNLVGADLDAEPLIKKILDQSIFKRFVVKRPLKSKPFFKPSGHIQGKTIRYDIYSRI